MIERRRSVGAGRTRGQAAVAAATIIPSVAAGGALIAAAILLLAAPLVSAQSVQLTPEQARMLEALPPAQRQQALQAIRRLQDSADGELGQSSIRETDEGEDDRVSDDEPDAFELDEEMLRRADARSRLVVNFRIVEEITPTELEDIESDPVLSRLVGTRLFILDEAGILTLPGLEPIPLLGLEEEEIEQRLQAESELNVFNIDARLLQQEPIGVEALKPFGYEIFEQGDERDFEAPATGPVPSDYLLGPGDSVRIQLFGNTSGVYEYEISRDGVLTLPEIGPVTVGGMTYSEFRSDVQQRVAEMLIGTQVSVSMGPLRTIRVFVLGDVKKPGSHVVNGLATISTALYEADGVTEIGSLRGVELKRKGRLVTRLDMYDMLIAGDTSDDRRLLPGDVIFVPPVGDTIAISGAVKRPAIYEARTGTTLADAVRLAGGLAPDAFGEAARLERIDENRVRTVETIDLTADSAASVAVTGGDTLIVPKVLPDIDNAVQLSGHVYRPGNYAWRSNMRLTDLIGSVYELQPGVDMNYVLVRREGRRGDPIEAVSADLAAAMARPGGADDIALTPRDQVHVFNLDLGRQRVIAPIIDELKRQATHDLPARQVEVSGYVRAPGTYPLEPGMRVSDLIRAGGMLSEEAYSLEAELTRYSVDNGQVRVVDTRQVDLAAVIRGEDAADMALAPYDFLAITRIPEWDTTWTVSLEGEVRFPGDYRVRRGETLIEVIDRAGGLTDAAFPEGAVFLRESLKEREQEQFEMLARRLEADLTTLSLQMAETGGSDTLATGQALLEQLRTTQAVGRLVIDPRHLQSRARDAARNRIELRDGDQLLVPQKSQVVTVIGETQQNTSHLYVPDLTRDDYINLSGGLTRRADKGRIYVVRANGAVVVRGQSRWLGRGGNVDIRPGDTIVVPLDADRIRPLTFWTNVTQILYQGAIAVAAISTFDN